MVEELNQNDWNGVYYDRDVMQFYMMSVEENGVQLIDAFDGEEVEFLNEEEFKDLARDGNFKQISEDVRKDPVSLIEQLIQDATNAISGDKTGFEYQPHNVDFARIATRIEHDEDAPYM